MRRKLNLRVLACLALGLPVLAAGVHLLHGRQVQRNAGTLLQQADRAEEQGDRAAAVDYLQRYLSLSRADAAVWARLGLLLNRQAVSYPEHMKAFFVIEQALRLDPEQHDARRQLARIALNLRRHGDAREHLHVLLRTFPDDAELEDLQGQCAVAAARFAEADQWWERAARHAPAQVDYRVRRAYLLRRRLKRPEDADRVMEELIAANPRLATAYLARGRYRAEFDGNEPAASDIAQALRLAPDDAEILLAAADLDLARNRPEEARSHLEAGIRKHPRDGRFLLSMARLELRAGRRAPAADYLRRSVRLLTDFSTRWTAADLLLDAGDRDTARIVLAEVEKAGFSRPQVDYLRARLQIEEENWSAARQLLENARQGLGDSPTLLGQAHLLLALCHQNLGNPDLQLAACRAALAVDPTRLSVRLTLARANAAVGRFDEALALYESLAAQAPFSRLETGRLLLRRARSQPAAKRQWAEVERVCQEAPEEARKSVEGRLLWAEVLVAEGRLADAEKHLRTACAEQPRQVEYRVALAAVADRRDHSAQAAQVLEAAERELGDGVDLRLARAARIGNDPKEKASLARLARDTDSFAQPDRVRLLRGLARAGLRAGDLPLARRMAERLARLRPNDVESRFLAFRLALRARDVEASRRDLTELRQIEGADGALWRCGEAALWLRFAKADDRGGLAAARKQLAEAAKLRPHWGPIALLDAELCEREGNRDRAIERYREAVMQGERQPPVVRRVVQLLHERHRYAEAEEMLRQLQEETPLAGSLGRLAAEVSLLGRRDPEHTLELARKAVADDATDYRELLWFGQVLAALDRRPEAEKAFRRAVRLKADVPETWANLALFLARGKQTEEAETVLRDARGKLDPAVAALPLAVCREALGQRERAAELYQAALKARPDDPAVMWEAASFQLRAGQVAEAEPLLRQLLASKKASADLAARARRGLALGLALTGNYARFKEAKTLVEQNLRQANAGVEDQRARALVLAMQPGHRRESIRVLEELFVRSPASADEQFLLIRLHEADRDWPKARAGMLDLLTATEAKNPLYLTYFVAALLRHDDPETAEHWLEQLEKLEPNSWRTIEAKCRLLGRQGRGKEASQLLEAQTAGNEAPRLLAAARLLEELEQTDAAETLYRRYRKIASHPEDSLVVAEFLGRRGRLDEALDLAERAAPKCRPETFALFCGGIVRVKGAADPQWQRVERWLTAASARSPKSLTVLLALAQLRDAQARYADAQAIYRKILAADPRNVMAANNLAVLLALRRKGPEALEWSRQAIEQAGPQAPLLDTRGTAYLSAGQVKPALDDLEEAVAQHPTAPRYFHLARAYRAAKDHGAALLAYRKAKKLGLQANHLHPLERAEYEIVRAEHENN